MGWWSKLRRLFPRSSSKAIEGQLAAFERLIGYRFRNRKLLRLSLTHRSATRPENGWQYSNERLEFLGDAVLGLVIGEQLFLDNTELDEGGLTKRKALLVSETALSYVAMEIGLNKYIFLSSDEEKAGGRARASIVSDAFESVIAAVYLDGGLEMARRLILKTIYIRRDDVSSDESQHNYKGELLELVQARGGGLPRYDTISESGPDHNKTFHIIVTVAGQRAGDGKGSSKKEAEQHAARAALEHLGVLVDESHK